MFLLVFKKGDKDAVIDVKVDVDKCSIGMHQQLW